MIQIKLLTGNEDPNIFEEVVRIIRATQVPQSVAVGQVFYYATEAR
jgi:hypothetical protein